MRTVLLSLAISLILSSASSAEPQIYERTFELSPFAVNLGEFEQLLTQVRNYVNTLEADPERSEFSRPSETLSLKTTEEEYSFRAEALGIEPSRIRGKVIDLTYYYNTGKPSVSNVYFIFGDHRNRLTVEGDQPEHVDAVMGLIQKELSRHEVTFGGFRFRMLLWILLAAITIALSQACAAQGFKERTFLVLWGCAFLAMVVAPFLPTEVWFAGFRLYIDDVSFLDQYASHFTFFGFLIALLVPMVSHIRQRMRRNRENGNLTNG